MLHAWRLGVNGMRIFSWTLPPHATHGGSADFGAEGECAFFREPDAGGTACATKKQIRNLQAMGGVVGFP